MTRTEFYYRKAVYFGRTLTALIFLGFIAYFVSISYDRSFPDPSSRDVFANYLFYFFIFIVSSAVLLGLYLFIASAKIAFLSAPALAMDKDYLIINGKRQLTWSEIAYIKYVKGRVTRTAGRKVRGRSVYYLYIKPHQGRKVRVDISYLDSRIEAIFEALDHFAPNLEIRGWKK